MNFREILNLVEQDINYMSHIGVSTASSLTNGNLANVIAIVQAETSHFNYDITKGDVYITKKAKFNLPTSYHNQHIKSCAFYESIGGLTPYFFNVLASSILITENAIEIEISVVIELSNIRKHLLGSCEQLFKVMFKQVQLGASSIIAENQLQSIEIACSLANGVFSCDLQNNMLVDRFFLCINGSRCVQFKSSTLRNISIDFDAEIIATDSQINSYTVENSNGVTLGRNAYKSVKIPAVFEPVTAYKKNLQQVIKSKKFVCSNSFIIAQQEDYLCFYDLQFNRIINSEMDINEVQDFYLISNSLLIIIKNNQDINAYKIVGENLVKIEIDKSIFVGVQKIFIRNSFIGFSTIKQANGKILMQNYRHLLSDSSLSFSRVSFYEYDKPLFLQQKYADSIIVYDRQSGNVSSLNSIALESIITGELKDEIIAGNKIYFNDYFIYKKLPIFTVYHNRLFNKVEPDFDGIVLPCENADYFLNISASGVITIVRYDLIFNTTHNLATILKSDSKAARFFEVGQLLIILYENGRSDVFSASKQSLRVEMNDTQAVNNILKYQKHSKLVSSLEVDFNSV